MSDRRLESCKYYVNVVKLRYMAMAVFLLWLDVFFYLGGMLDAGL